MLIKKIPDTSGLVTTIVLNTKFSEVENKISDHAKYITTPDFNKLTAESLVIKTNFDNKLINFNEQLPKIKTFRSSKETKQSNNKRLQFFLGRIYFPSNDGSQNTLVYQPTLDTLELKKDKGTDYFLSWKSKEVFNSKLKALYTAFLHRIKHCE